MKLLFNKKTFESHWFEDDDNPGDYTDKIPPNTGYIFDKETDDWILKLKPIEEPEQE